LHSLSVVVSSYNQPNALRLTLAGFAAQDDLDFGLIIADDGSDDDIRRLVEAFAQGAPFPVQFITQPHDGFRKARILNKAIVAAQGRQLVITDGDCVPFRNMVSAHRTAFRKGRFATAGYVYLNLQQSTSLTPDSVALGAHEGFLTLKPRAKLYGTHLENLFARLVGKQWKPKMKGGNFSADRQCLLDVDGFDESYNGMSSVDSDLRNRLRNLPCKGISLWHKAFVCHLDHKLDPRRLTGAVRRPRDRALYYGSYNRVKALKGISHLTPER
jgi:glycosyltransferase involved in cell wall biosynthesis